MLHTNEPESYRPDERNIRETLRNRCRLDDHLEPPDRPFPETPQLTHTNPGPSRNCHPVPGSQRCRSLVGPKRAWWMAGFAPPQPSSCCECHFAVYMLCRRWPTLRSQRIKSCLNPVHKTVFTLSFKSWAHLSSAVLVPVQSARLTLPLPRSGRNSDVCRVAC